MKTILWLRDESKPGEERCALTPKGAKTLIDQGIDLYVEHSNNRAFPDEMYAICGAHMVASGSWKNAPKDAIILGLKELETDSFALAHTHIHFAHVYKGQFGDKQFLERFLAGGGKLYDLEYLVNSEGKRIAAFGHWAGFTGAALAIDAWAMRERGVDYNTMAPLSSYENSAHLVDTVKNNLAKINTSPRVLIIGANGRCGVGAKDFLNRLGIKPTCWGSKDTKDSELLKTTVNYDILINTALIKNKTTPFITNELIDNTPNRKLSLISDVGCDPNGPCNPLPVYNEATTLEQPVKTLRESPLLEITAIDHLPTLLPKESSEDFEEQLLEHLITFLKGETSVAFSNAIKTFEDKKIELGIGITQSDSPQVIQ